MGAKKGTIPQSTINRVWFKYAGLFMFKLLWENYYWLKEGRDRKYVLGTEMKKQIWPKSSKKFFHPLRKFYQTLCSFKDLIE